MYHVVEIDGFIHSAINEKGKPDKYTKPKDFKTKKDAQKWIDKHSYPGMSERYEIYQDQETDYYRKIGGYHGH